MATSNIDKISAHLSVATAEDIPKLVSIVINSQFPEPTMAFFFPDWPSTKTMERFYTARLAQRVEDPKAYLLKITYGDEIVGLGCMALEEQIEGGRNSSPTTPIEGYDYEFSHALGECFRRTEQLMEGRKAYWLTSCATLPSYQGKGLGSLLIRHCANKADEKGLPMYLTSFPKARDLYARFGFVEKVRFDFDLNEWGMKNRGYGIYRSYGMVREPSGEQDSKKTEPPV